MKHKSSEISGKQTQEKKKVVFPYGNFDRYANSSDWYFRYYGYRSVSYRDNTQEGTVRIMKYALILDLEWSSTFMFEKAIF